MWTTAKTNQSHSLIHLNLIILNKIMSQGAEVFLSIWLVAAADRHSSSHSLDRSMADDTIERWVLCTRFL